MITSGANFKDVFAGRFEEKSSTFDSLAHNPEQLAGITLKEKYILNHIETIYEGLVTSVSCLKKEWFIFVIYKQDSNDYDEDNEYKISLAQLLADFLLNDVEFCGKR